MAGLTSTLYHPCKPHLPKSQLPKSLKPFSFQFQSFSLRLQFPGTTRYPSVSTTIAARYRGGEDLEASEASDDDYDDDEALDVSSLESDTVRLIDEQQNMVGIVPKDEAIEKAKAAQLDLVIISAEADPPVVRIMNFDKYRYELQKKERDQQKKNSAGRTDVKEVKMGYNIDDHDYSVRFKAAEKFLKEGHKIKILVRLKGRENKFRNKAIELLRRVQNDLGELVTEESKNFNDKIMFMVLAPKKTVVVQKSPEPSKEEEKEVSATV